MKYDYLIVGSGLFGATFAHFAAKAVKRCLVIDKRKHLGGSVYCEPYESPSPSGEGWGDALLGGRLAEYKYYDMAPIIEQVMNLWK